jgi:Zn-dependent protease with chaperone function
LDGIHLNGIILIAAFLLAAGATFSTNWLALIPWRRSRDKHWTEQARILYPIFVAARSNLFIVPGTITLGVLLAWPNTSPLWLFAGIFAMFGATAGTLFLDREIYARIVLPDLLRDAAFGWLMRFVIWIIFITAAVAMPNEFNLRGLYIGIAVVLLWALWARGGWIWLGRTTGLFGPAPERLLKIVTETASRMNVPYQNVLLMRSSLCQAYAMPDIGLLLFTKRLLEISPDIEIAAVCSHELAHLTESRWARYLRSIRILAYLPWIFFNPLMHTFGLSAFYGLFFFTFFVPCIYSQISRKLESRADAMAKANENDDGVYARALARLYEDNLMPAVTVRKQTHPHLYDRLVAAGITPDFPRPEPARSLAWHGAMFAGLGGMLLAAFAIRLIGAFNGVEH